MERDVCLTNGNQKRFGDEMSIVASKSTTFDDLEKREYELIMLNLSD